MKTYLITLEPMTAAKTSEVTVAISWPCSLFVLIRYPDRPYKPPQIKPATSEAFEPFLA